MIFKIFIFFAFWGLGPPQNIGALDALQDGNVDKIHFEQQPPVFQGIYPLGNAFSNVSREGGVKKMPAAQAKGPKQ